MKRRIFIFSVLFSLLALLLVTESCKKRSENIIRGRWTKVNMDVEDPNNQIWDFYDNENLYIFSSDGTNLDTVICTYRFKSSKKLEVTVSNGGYIYDYTVYKLNKRVLRMARYEDGILAEFIEFSKN